MRRLKKGRFRFFRGQRGIGLLETLVAVAILAGIGMAVLAALDTNSRANRTLDEQVTGVNLATAYLEAIRSEDFDTSGTYSNVKESIDPPTGYRVNIYTEFSRDDVEWFESYSEGDTLQRITISVSRDGGKPVLSMCTYKYK